MYCTSMYMFIYITIDTIIYCRERDTHDIMISYIYIYIDLLLAAR